jgi:transposase
MIDMLKRHEIQVLRRAGHTQRDVAKLAGVSLGSVRRVEVEPDVTHLDLAQERERRQIGRPAKAASLRSVVVELLAVQPDLLSVEILRRAKLAGYTGAKTALYDLIRTLRPETVQPLVRFEGLPAEFTQHDFGHVDVRFLSGAQERVHFFASRLKYSRWVEVTLVPDERAETLVRTWVDHFAPIGGIPLLAVFDRPRTVALKWDRNGHVTEWNPLFAGVTLDLGIGIELLLARAPAAERIGGESGRVGQRILFHTAAVSRRCRSATAARGAADRGQYRAALAGDARDPCRAARGGTAAAAGAERGAG